MRVVIDRFEGDFAVVEICENQFANLPKILVPDAKEGDVILITMEDNTNKLKENKERLHRLFRKND